MIEIGYQISCKMYNDCVFIVRFECSYIVMKTNNSEGNSKHETKLI